MGPTLGVRTIYMGKPEIQDGKSNYSRHSNWEALENMGCDLRMMKFFLFFLVCSADLDNYSLYPAVLIQWSKASYNILTQGSIICLPKKKNTHFDKCKLLVLKLGKLSF